jgi:hypothetical protein
VSLGLLLSDAISNVKLASFQINFMIWKDRSFSDEIASLSENAIATLLENMSLKKLT